MFLFISFQRDPKGIICYMLHDFAPQKVSRFAKRPAVAAYLCQQTPVAEPA
jgi:hypothetical protein